MSDNDNKPDEGTGANPLPAFPGAAPDSSVPPAPQQPQTPQQPPVPPAPQLPTQQEPQAPQQPPQAPQHTPPQAPAAPQYTPPQAGSPQYSSPQFGSQQPGPQQPGPQQPGSQQPGSYPPAPQPKRKLGTGATIAIVGGSIFVVIILVAAIVFGVSRFTGKPGGGGDSPEAGGGGGASASSPADAVTGYLTAIADADAKKALSYLASAPDNTTLLTDEVLAESNKLAPITAIKVPDVSSESGSVDVTATYLMGGESVTTTLGVVDYEDDGEWQISAATGYIYTSPFDGLGLTINGQEVDGDEVEVFPGTYQLATSLKNFTLSGETVVTSTEPYSSVETSSIKPVLTDEALQTFRGLVREAVNACIATTTLAAGCGLDLPATISDGTQLNDGTITRSLSADANATLDSLEATPSYDNPTLVEGEYIGSPSVEADCTKDGTTGRCSIYFAPALGTPSVDMASDNPTVIWD